MNADSMATFLIYGALAAPVFGTAVALVAMLADRRPAPAEPVYGNALTNSRQPAMDMAARVEQARNELRIRREGEDSTFSPEVPASNEPDTYRDAA